MKKGSQKKKVKVASIEFEPSAIAVRREVSEESHVVLDKVISALRTELLDGVSFNDPDACGVTLVPYKRLSKQQKLAGPSTDEITDKVPTSGVRLDVSVGSLAIFGASYERVNKHCRTMVSAYLAVTLNSKALLDEERQYAQAFENYGLPLRPSDHDGPFEPHCSLGKIEAHHQVFEDPRLLDHLSRVAGLGPASDFSLVLDPVHRFDQSAP